jgi:hypothetical protein
MNGVPFLKWVAHSRIYSNPFSSAPESREKLSNEKEELKMWRGLAFSIVGVASQTKGGVGANL